MILKSSLAFSYISDDDPLVEHLRFSSECRFANSKIESLDSVRIFTNSVCLYIETFDLKLSVDM
jgi:hypothetical protein